LNRRHPAYEALIGFMNFEAFSDALKTSKVNRSFTTQNQVAPKKQNNRNSTILQPQ